MLTRATYTGKHPNINVKTQIPLELGQYLSLVKSSSDTENDCDFYKRPSPVSVNFLNSLLVSTNWPTLLKLCARTRT